MNLGDPDTPLGKWETLEDRDTKISVRQFETGATRDTEEGKLDYEGFLSPLALDCYARYMNKHRQMKDGSLRASDNWQKGMPLSTYMKSMWRHLIQVWERHRVVQPREGDEGLEDALCGVIFNAMGYLHEALTERVEVVEGEVKAHSMGLREAPKPWNTAKIEQPEGFVVDLSKQELIG